MKTTLLTLFFVIFSLFFFNISAAFTTQGLTRGLHTSECTSNSVDFSFEQMYTKDGSFIFLQITFKMTGEIEDTNTNLKRSRKLLAEILDQKWQKVDMKDFAKKSKKRLHFDFSNNVINIDIIHIQTDGWKTTKAHQMHLTNKTIARVFQIFL